MQRKRSSLDDDKQKGSSSSSNKRILEEADYSRTHIAANEELWSKLAALEDENRVGNILSNIESLFRATTGSKAKQQLKRTIYLCSRQTNQAIASFWDKGWSCGYRNCQTVMTYLEKQLERGSPVLRRVPSVRGLQVLLEEAWRDGFDPQGAAQLQHRVLGTQKWIGTTEVYTMLVYLGIRCTILDFNNNQAGTSHDIMMDWLQSYFESAVTAPHSSSTGGGGSKDAFSTMMQTSARNGKAIHLTDRPPVYMQHAGHSRTVVGIETYKDGTRHLVVLDPGRKISRKTDANGKPCSTTLASFRLDTKTIVRKDQYQLLVLGHIHDGRSEGGPIRWIDSKGFLLTEWERDTVRNVTSIRAT